MGKSSKHKAQNVYHFIPFSERIANVNTDVIHRIRRSDDQNDNTFFGEALSKWTDLDLTDHFVNFRKEIQGQVQTFEQLVHYKDDIITSLKTHMAVLDSLAVNALLDLLIQLARDLQQDFIPHFHDFFTLLVQQMTTHSQNAEVLEQIFQTLAYLFRVLWRYLIKDFKSVFSYFSQLLHSSQKDYIKLFAAESCAYLLRKVKQQNELLNFLLRSLKTSPELTDGIGLLLFEMMKGVKYRFHTVSDKVFPLILQKLGPFYPQGKKKLHLPYSRVEKAVAVLVKECAGHTNKEYCKPLWEVLLSTVSQVNTRLIGESKEGNSSVSTGLVQHLCRLLRVVSIWITYNNGSIVTDAEQVTAALHVVCKSNPYQEQLGSDIIEAVSNLLKTCYEKLSVESIFQLNSVVFASQLSFSMLKSFVNSMQDMPFFEKDILPRLMNKLHSTLPQMDAKQKQEVLAFVTELVLHKTNSSAVGDSILHLNTYHLDHSWSRSSQGNIFSSYIDSLIIEMSNSDRMLTLTDISILWGAVVCSFHLSINDLPNKSIQLWKRLLTQTKCENEVMVEKMLPVLCQLLRGILSVTLENGSDTLAVDYEDICDIVRLRTASVYSVQMMDLFLSHHKSACLLTQQRLGETYTLLESNLVSPSHVVRLITCHILSLFPLDLPHYDDGVTRTSPFKIMYEAEKIIPNIHNYREKLIHLRKLECDITVKCFPVAAFHKAPVLFLLGNEFWNFKLMWEPLSDIITSYAVHFETHEFWEVMLSQLKLAAKSSENELRFTESASACVAESAMSELFENYLSQSGNATMKPDFTSYRLQLWKTLKKFPEKCVLKSDEICQLYLNFLKNEFSATDDDSLMYQSILDQNTANTQSQVEVQQGEVSDDLLNNAQDENKLVSPEKTEKRRKAAIQSLLAHLDLIAMFKKQRSMFNESHVQSTFYDLLKHRHPAVQKAAFECVLTYKNPHILPYRDNFFRLLDDKTFKSEIVLFRVDEESSQVKENDRDELLPVLMRILYGKFHGKTGKDTAGKSRSNLRRSIVFGFLCGCRPDELRYFLELLFQPFMQFVTDDPVKMVNNARTDVSLEKFIPLKIIKGVLNTVLVVSKKFGHRLQTFSHSLLHIILGEISILSGALLQRQKLLKGAVNLLRTLHHTAIERLTEFFENFEELDFTSKDIEAVFHAVVWPQMQKFTLEGVHHPTPLLKLFLFWSHSQRFFPLLAYAKSSESVSCTPLHSIFSLLNASKISPSVEAAILDLVNNLLQNTTDSDISQLPPLPEEFILSNDWEDKTAEHLLLPHVHSLLIYLQASLHKITPNLLKGRQQTFSTELKILARISTFVTVPEECQSLCDLLVSLFSQRISVQQDMEENMLKSLINLMQYIDKPDKFYRTISQLFSTLGRRESRSLLCKLFKVISEKDVCLRTVGDIIEKLNAWDKNKAEEPDYIVRLEAFSEINNLLSSINEITVDVLLPVVFNCCHFINSVDDLSIRDNATHCIIGIVKKLSSPSLSCSKSFNIAIEQALIPQLKLGIRHKSEVVRHEFLTVLQSLVNNYPDHHMFTGLKDLCDKDPEADFFENIRHIQIHKRSRALRRLYKHLKDHHFRAEIHMSYFIPLIYTFLTDFTYSKHANIQDAAIDLLGAIGKQLPWQCYLQQLRFYLNLLPKKVEAQRQLIRAVVTLLDAFHFNLRYSNYTTCLAPKAVAESCQDKTADQHSNESMENEIFTSPGEQENPDESLPGLFEAQNIEVDNEDSPDGLVENTEEGSFVICSPAAATRIQKTIVISLLPQLHNIITHKAKHEDEHKLVKSKHPEDDEILRVPIALAMIKLLKNLSAETMENMLPGILLKICAFLRSRSRDIRTTARETLEKIALSLGVRFLPFILDELRATLTRGYQLHVLSFTTYQLLKALVPVVKAGDLDPALATIQQVFYAELFGQVADEKEVSAIKAKYFEAQFIKGYEAYELLGKCISPNFLSQLLQPIERVLESTYNQRTANKAEILLAKVARGLMANSSIPVQTMMVFINSLIAHLKSGIEEKRSKSEDTNKEKASCTVPESCLLLPQVAPRGGFKPKSSRKTNIHVLVEFGLQLLNMCLKKSLILPTEQMHLQLLDPMIPVLGDCLSSAHVKTTANAMRCISWLFKFPLPSLKVNASKIVQSMFITLQKYAAASSVKGGNQELINMCFKAVTVLVRDVTYYDVTTDQLQVLLTYCEEDLYNYSRQSTAFNLIRAILARKLDIPQLHQVIDKLFEMSITANSANIMLQCRQVIQHYLLNYPIGKHLKKHLYFYIDNLNYEKEEGRESALEMMISIFSVFPQKLLNNHCPKFFTALSMASFNDASARCRKLICVAIRTLIGKIDVKRRKFLFDDVIKWMKSDNIDIRTMGCQVCGIFVEVEGGKFEFYLDKILPLLQQQMNPANYTQIDEEPLKTIQEDMCLLAVLNTFMKIVRELSIIKHSDLTSELNQIWSHVHAHLTYPHKQVRLLTCQLLGLLFSAWEPAEVAEQQQSSEDKRMTFDSQGRQQHYILENTPKLIHNFAKAFCLQLQTPALDEILGSQVVKNLLYLARLTEALGRLDDLVWLTKRVMKEANMEVISNVKISIKRNFAFKWTASVGLFLSSQSVNTMLPYVLSPLQREMATQTHQNTELKNLAHEVADLLKKQVGVPAFTAAFANCQKWKAEKRDLKKRQLAAEAVTNPDVAARKKIRHNLKKREAMKRKIEEKRPQKRVKKNKLSILNVSAEDENVN